MFHIQRTHLKKLLKIGIPSAGEQLSYNGSQMIITLFITFMGTQALAAKVYTQNLMMFIMLFGAAISQGTQILMGAILERKNLMLCLPQMYERLMGHWDLSFFLPLLYLYHRRICLPFSLAIVKSLKSPPHFSY
ncbi:hypothetical protein BSAF29S_05311 [Bacillus safensis subsp. safensis]